MLNKLIDFIKNNRDIINAKDFLENSYNYLEDSDISDEIKRTLILWIALETDAPIDYAYDKRHDDYLIFIKGNYIVYVNRLHALTKKELADRILKEVWIPKLKQKNYKDKLFNALRKAT